MATGEGAEVAVKTKQTTVEENEEAVLAQRQRASTSSSVLLSCTDANLLGGQREA